ncbi:competence type IV pilus minor pilin ComGD [Enterococcus sp. 5H]|uniref:competence type IV pilus minor pilin ComGD n=1 Tax=Enterococcus sp. 5H TaxID=1229490 RepID=UPI00230434E8|nr:competence type IV pilus minor pilin ComGD [Enterococcus sp. 5H]
MKGFTLIESLLVLFICSIFLLLPTLSIKQWQRTLEVEQFLSSFEKRILLTQQMAIVNSVNTQILFSDQGNRITFISPKISANLEEYQLIIPSSLLADGPGKITFKKGSGNNGNLAKYSFVWEEKQQVIEFQFQLGSGRYVKKIKDI